MRSVKKTSCKTSFTQSTRASRAGSELPGRPQSVRGTTYGAQYASHNERRECPFIDQDCAGSALLGRLQ
jgi:hypothetical protein